jgi:hypothetical protein
MKKCIAIVFIIFSLGSQAQDVVFVGVHTFSPLAGPIISNMGYGLSLGAATQKRENYYMGLKVDVWFDFDQKSVDIKNNLQSDESIISELKVMSLTMLNRFDLTPQSKAKIFFDANIGFRFGKFDVKHNGYFIGLKSEENVYSKTSGGIEGQLLVNFYIPFNKQSQKGLQFKTGWVTGSPIIFVDPVSVGYANSGFFYGPESSSSSSWIIGIDYMIGLNK